MIIATGVAHLEPEWTFSFSKGTVELKLQWHNANTGRLLTMPPKIYTNQSNTSPDAFPNMQNSHRQATNTVNSSVRASPSQYFYSSSLRQSKFRSNPSRHTPPRFQDKKYRINHSATENIESTRSSNVISSAAENTNIEGSPISSAISDNDNTKMSDIEIRAYIHDKTHPCDSPSHSVISDSDRFDDIHVNEFADSYSNHSGSIHSDLSGSEHGNDNLSNIDNQSDVCSDHDSTLNGDKTDSDIFSNMLCESDDDTSNPIQYGIAGNTDAPPFESENYDPSHLGTMSDDQGTLYQTEHIDEPILISNNHAISISGSDSIECIPTESDSIVQNG